MTTIAYHKESGIIAVDSRRVDYNGEITTDSAIKMQSINGKRWFMTGKRSSFDSFVDIHSNSIDKSNHYHIKSPDVAGLIVDEGVIYFYGIYEDDKPTKRVIDHNYSIGSGDCYAMAALDLGCGAKEAVEAAAKRDIYTGGEIQVYKLEDLK